MTLDERKQIMIEYLKLKIHEQDWHGVCDAGMDLRDLAVEEQLNNIQVSEMIAKRKERMK